MAIKAIIGVALAIASTALSVVKGLQEADAAKKRANLEKKRVDLLAQQRELQRSREIIALKRQARERRASIINGSAISGVQYSTTADAAANSVNMSVARELKFSEQGASLASQADALTLQSINFDASRAQQGALIGGISSALKGISAVADSDLFSSAGTGGNVPSPSSMGISTYG